MMSCKFYKTTQVSLTTCLPAIGFISHASLFFFFLLYIFDTQFMSYNSNKLVIKLTHILCRKKHKIMLKVSTHISFNLINFCVPDDICSLDSQ